MTTPGAERDCAHDWAWLPQPIFLQSVDGTIVDCVNVECLACGEQTWAFGIMPNRRAITRTISPREKELASHAHARPRGY